MRYQIIVWSFCINCCFPLLALNADDDFVNNDGSTPSGANSVTTVESKETNVVTATSADKSTQKTNNPLVPNTQLGMKKITKPATDKNSVLPSWPKIISIVGVIIFLAALAVYLKLKKNPRFLKGLKQQPQQRQLTLLSDLTLSHATISLVSLGDKIYLVGANDHAVTCLDRIVDPVEKDKIIYSSENKTEGFHQEYNEMLHQMNQGFPEEQQNQQESVPGETAHGLESELDSLKARLKELA